MPLLHNGDRFPRLSIRKVGGGTIELPGDLAGSFGVVLIYRGAWCPYCNAQLAAFARASEVTAIRISMIGLAISPGTAVLPKCSMPTTSAGSSTPRSRSASTANWRGQSGSYGTSSTSSMARQPGGENPMMRAKRAR